MKHFERKYILALDVWNSDVLIIFTNNIDQSVKKHKIIPDSDISESAAVTFDEKEVPTFIGAIIFEIESTNPGVIAHECYHLTNNILYYKGLKYTKESEEAFAYTIDWIVKNVSNMFNAVIKKHKARK